MAITNEERAKLLKIAAKKGLSEDEAVEQAIKEFIEKHGRAR